MALVNGMKYSEIQKLTTVSERAMSCLCNQYRQMGHVICKWYADSQPQMMNGFEASVTMILSIVFLLFTYSAVSRRIYWVAARPFAHWVAGSAEANLWYQSITIYHPVNIAMTWFLKEKGFSFSPKTISYLLIWYRLHVQLRNAMRQIKWNTSSSSGHVLNPISWSSLMKVLSTDGQPGDLMPGHLSMDVHAGKIFLFEEKGRLIFHFILYKLMSLVADTQSFLHCH